MSVGTRHTPDCRYSAAEPCSCGLIASLIGLPNAQPTASAGAGGERKIASLIADARNLAATVTLDLQRFGSTQLPTVRGLALSTTALLDAIASEHLASLHQPPTAPPTTRMTPERLAEIRLYVMNWTRTMPRSYAERVALDLLHELDAVRAELAIEHAHRIEDLDDLARMTDERDAAVARVEWLEQQARDAYANPDVSDPLFGIADTDWPDCKAGVSVVLTHGYADETIADTLRDAIDAAMAKEAAHA